MAFLLIEGWSAEAMAAAGDAASPTRGDAVLWAVTAHGDEFD
jgi:hypothetical protein